MINDIRFTKALNDVLVHEGGYSNNPVDKGGETNYGITAAVYNAYRTKKKLPVQSVKNLSNNELREIYYNNYWLAGSCDKLPPLLAPVHFDTCVNNGVRQANKFLQRAIGTTDDGIIGPKTLAAIQGLGFKRMEDVLFQYMDKRTNFYIDLALKDNTQLVFLKGWLQRCRTVERSSFLA